MTLIERIGKHSRQVGACVEWTARIGTAGYGRISVDGKTADVHRVVYAHWHGPIPPSMQVCHYCDNRRCLRIDHLFLGTHADNHADKVAKGRQARNSLPGASNGRARLTDEKVREIRSSKESGRAIAKRMGVSPSVVFRIRRNERWTHVA